MKAWCTPCATTVATHHTKDRHMPRAQSLACCPTNLKALPQNFDVKLAKFLMRSRLVGVA